MKRIVLLILCSMPVLKGYSEYSSALELMKSFINYSQKTDKNFEYWIEQLRYHVHHKEKFSAFECQLKDCFVRGSSQEAFKIFINHKNLFHSSLQVELFKIGLPNIRAAFNERLMQHKKLVAKPTSIPLPIPLLATLGRIFIHSHSVLARDMQRVERMKRYQIISVWLEKNYPPIVLSDRPEQKEASQKNSINVPCESLVEA